MENKTADRANKEVIISARHLKKVFGSGESEQVIYSDFDIDIYKGDFTVIMGASGAGKSTLMYSLSGMDTPNAGTITFCGTEITGMSSDRLAVFRRKNCGFVRYSRSRITLYYPRTIVIRGEMRNIA